MSSIPSGPLPSVPAPAVAVAPPAADPIRAKVLGVPLAVADYDQTLRWMDDAVEQRRRVYVCVAAVHTVMACRDDARLREAVMDADLVLPDGQPLVWALRALGHTLPDRVYGPELMGRACERAARN